jgi:hypothetical protein
MPKSVLESGNKDQLSNTSNGASSQIEMTEPYVAHIDLQGVCPIIFHRWNVESVEAKSASAKGSKAKKTDDVESFVSRDDKGIICVPGEYLRQAVLHAAKFRQDPRSPRKSFSDLAKAGIFSIDELVPITSASGKPAKEWDYLDRRRMTVQRNSITRSRPAFHAGWRAQFHLQVVLPEYISPAFLNDLIQLSGKVIGLADSRPSYGRFLVVGFRTSEV